MLTLLSALLLPLSAAALAIVAQTNSTLPPNPAGSWITNFPAEFEPPTDSTFGSTGANLINYTIPHSNPSLDLELSPGLDGHTRPIPYRNLGHLLVSCLYVLADAAGRSEKEPAIPQRGLFGCRDDDANPSIYLNIRAVVPHPAVSDTTQYQYLITALRGIDSWGFGVGLVEGNLRLRRTDESDFFWGGIFLMQLGLEPRLGAADVSVTAV